MLDIKYIREHAAAVAENARLRHMAVDVAALLTLDEQVRVLQQRVDLLRRERNQTADELKQMLDKSTAEAQAVIERGKAIKQQLETVEAELSELSVQWRELMMQIPNLTHPDSPTGKDDSENKEISRWGEPTQFAFTPKDHLTLGTDLGTLDFEAGANVSGRGFYYLKNDAALLELALTNYAMDICIQAGFTPMITPDLARREILEGTGFNPRGDETQIYNIENTDLSLIATAEIPVAGYYRNHTFGVGELDQPKKIVALSHCFRTEAGAYGRESKGLYRVHQFTKVEMFIFCKPEQSPELHEELRQIEEQIMQGLKLPYRVVDICTGDMGAAAYRKYDLEAWMPFRNDWGEVTSTSNCTDFQARRLNIKYTTDSGDKALVHTLNGTAAAMSRTPLAIMENYQQADGSISWPKVLMKYRIGGKISS